MDIMENLVLVPGLLNTGQLWEKQVQGVQDIAHVSIGNTIAGDSSIHDMAVRILDESPKQFSLAGLSMGGYVALEIVKLAPERVNRLALVNTQAQADSPDKIEYRKKTIEASQSGTFVGASKPFMAKLLGKDSMNNQDIVGCVQSMAQEVGRELFIKQQTAIMNREDKMSLLARINVPTLVIAGDEDQIIPATQSKELSELLPKGRLEVLSGCGHLSALERPDEVTALFRQWLRTY